MHLAGGREPESPFARSFLYCSLSTEAFLGARPPTGSPPHEALLLEIWMKCYFASVLADGEKGLLLPLGLFLLCRQAEGEVNEVQCDGCHLRFCGEGRIQRVHSQRVPNPVRKGADVRRRWRPRTEATWMWRF